MNKLVQTITLPIPLGSKAYAVSKKYNFETGAVDFTKVVPITITEVTLWRDGSVRHFISGNYKYLPDKVFASKEEAEEVLRESANDSTESA